MDEVIASPTQLELWDLETRLSSSLHSGVFEDDSRPRIFRCTDARKLEFSGMLLMTLRAEAATRAFWNISVVLWGYQIIVYIVSGRGRHGEFSIVSHSHPRQLMYFGCVSLHFTEFSY